MKTTGITTCCAALILLASTTRAHVVFVGDAANILRVDTATLENLKSVSSSQVADVAALPGGTVVALDIEDRLLRAYGPDSNASFS